MAKGLELSILRNDIIYEDGTFKTVIDDDEIARNIKTRLSINLGEYFLDTSYGFPYSDIFGSRVFSLSDLEATVKRFILETAGITKLTQFSMGFVKGSSRKLSINFSAQTIYGKYIVVDSFNPFGV